MVDLNESRILYEAFCAIAESYTSIVYLDAKDRRTYPIRLDQYSMKYEEMLSKGPDMRTALEAYVKDTVYKDDAISGLYPECHYLGAPVRTILFTGTGDLKEKEVYLLSPNSIQPPDVTRTWTRTMDVIYKKKNLYMWKGILNDRENGPENDYRSMRF